MCGLVNEHPSAFVMAFRLLRTNLELHPLSSLYGLSSHCIQLACTTRQQSQLLLVTHLPSLFPTTEAPSVFRIV
jgi:hypothetical protein